MRDNQIEPLGPRSQGIGDSTGTGKKPALDRFDTGSVSRTGLPGQRIKGSCQPVQPTPLLGDQRIQPVAEPIDFLGDLDPCREHSGILKHLVGGPLVAVDELVLAKGKRFTTSAQPTELAALHCLADTPLGQALRLVLVTLNGAAP